MKSKPILFSGEMVKSILEGRKSMTRRVIKGTKNTYEFLGLENGISLTAIDKQGDEYPKEVSGLWATFYDTRDYAPIEYPAIKSKNEVGDILWVRETCRWCEDLNGYCYKASQPYEMDNCRKYASVCEHTPKWRPSIYMPKEAARIWLRVTDVRVERLQDISNEDAKAEGSNWVVGHNVGWEEKMKRSAIERFRQLWDSLNDKRGYGWVTNPYVWVYGFEQIDGEKP